MKKEKDFYQISLKLILKNKENKILALRDASSGVFSGYYDLPGGTIDVSEYTSSLEDVLTREVNEETGNIKYKIVNMKPVAYGRHETLRSHSRIFYLFFEGEYIDGEVTISEEHLDYIWLDLKNVDIDTYFVSGMADGLKMYLNS